MTECASVDWDLLNREGVMEVAEKAAASVAGEYDVTEFDDLLQEAYIYLATKPDLKEAIETEQLGLLHYRLRADLINLAQSQSTKALRNVSYEEAREGAE